MEEKTSDDGQYGSEEQQETKGFGDSTECGWMQGILGLSDSGDRCLEGGPRVEAIFDVGDARLRLASRFSGERPCCGMIACSGLYSPDINSPMSEYAIRRSIRALFPGFPIFTFIKLHSVLTSFALKLFNLVRRASSSSCLSRRVSAASCIALSILSSSQSTPASLILQSWAPEPSLRSSL